MSETTGTTPAPMDAARAAMLCDSMANAHALASTDGTDFAHAAQCVRALAWLAAHPDCEGTWVGMGGAPAEGWRVVQLVGVGADDGYRTLAKGSPTPLAALLAAMEATT